jgi:hypothetical protein
MSYTTAIFDRSATDITNRTSKAFLNIADWSRVYNNSQLVNSLAAIMLDTPIAFTLITAPTITSIPNVTDLNTLTGNIETLRVAVSSESITGTTQAIKDDWEAGHDKPSPTYVHVNLWESTLDAIWEYYGGPDLDVDRVLSADLTVTTGTTLIIVDSLDANGFNITIEDGATLAII